MQLADVVLGAACRLAEEDGYVSLPDLMADPGVAAIVRSSARLTDVMRELEARHMVRMVCRYPVCRWAVQEAA